MNHHPRINAFSIFPPDTPFRIDWFGNAAYSRDINHSQPFIAVVLSEIPASSRDTWTYPTSFDGRLHQRHVFVPVGFLPYLHIGDIWTRDGFVRSPDYVQESFPININRESVTLSKAGTGKGEHCGFFLPFEAHPYHRSDGFDDIAAHGNIYAVENLLRDAAEHLSKKGVLVVEAGHNLETIGQAFPKLDFTWLETRAGNEHVFLLTREQLLRQS